MPQIPIEEFEVVAVVVLVLVLVVEEVVAWQVCLALDEAAHLASVRREAAVWARNWTE